MLFISQSSHLIALIMFTSICDDFLLLLILLFLIELPRAELNESDLGEPGVLALPLQRPWTRSWLVRIEVGGRQRQEAKGRHDWEESAPTKPILDRLEKVRGSYFVMMIVRRLTLLMRAVMRLLMMSPLKRKA